MYTCIRITVLVFNLIFLITGNYICEEYVYTVKFTSFEDIINHVTHYHAQRDRLNLKHQLCGLGILGIGVWIRVDMVQFDALLGKSMVPIAAYVLIGAGGVVMLISLAGCVGAMKENKSLLTLYFTFLLIIFLMETAAAVLGSLFYDQVKPFMSTYVETAMMKNYGDSDYELVTKSVDVLQQQFKCCGFDSPQDWNNATSFTTATVPISCCRDQNQPSCNSNFNTTNIYDQGCIDSLTDWMTGNLVYLLGVSIGVAVIQILGMVFSLCLCQQAGEGHHV